MGLFMAMEPGTNVKGYSVHSHTKQKQKCPKVEIQRSWLTATKKDFGIKTC